MRYCEPAPNPPADDFDHEHCDHGRDPSDCAHCTAEDWLLAIAVLVMPVLIVLLVDAAFCA